VKRLPIPPILQDLRLPVIGAPMFIVSGPELVIAQCKAGIVGSFPALNARPLELLEEWIVRIKTELADHKKANPTKKVAPFAVNQICHKTNTRLEHDMAVCVKHKVPIIITSLRAPREVTDAAHSYGAIVMHDVISIRHARKAIAEGADGLIAVCAGAGGHAGILSPFALVAEIRQWFEGPLALSGAIANGASILGAQAIGADFAYLGTRFIAAQEANADPRYKEAILASAAGDILYTNLFTGVHGNYLKSSVVAAGFDPGNLPQSDPSQMNFGSGSGAKAKVWRDIWGAGQGVGQIRDVPSVAEIVDRLEREYAQARARLCPGS
jgi:nitronate monooxygenase